MCGVFGIYGHTEASHMTYLGLHALQHRGQEAAGICSSTGSALVTHRASGLVQAAFSSETLARLTGSAAVGHVRYSTAGGSHLMNAQPLCVDYAHGSLAVAVNGNLTNYESVRHRLEGAGSIFQTTSDTETILHLMAASRAASHEARIADALQQVEGSFAAIFLTTTSLVAVRDPRGFRPLCLGKMQHEGREAFVVASEPVAFELMGATFIRDVEPGEMIQIDDGGMRSSRPFAPTARKACIFEQVYFARPDSELAGASVYRTRQALGRRLAEEAPVPHGTSPAIVIPVPDSGVPAALGYAAAVGLPYELGLIRSHYVGRTFIEPQQSIRHFGVRLKLHPNRAVLQGKRIVVIDDSVVRGTTSRKIVKMLRDAGAAEVHVRISSPPTTWPCYYGIDTPTRGELIASSHTVEEIRNYLTADSLAYLSLQGLLDAVRTVEGRSEAGYCHACFSGEYPVPFEAPSTARRSLPMQMS